MPLSRETLETLYQTMVRIRRFDERTVELFNAGHVKGTAHSYVGQEAVATGACAHLTKDDSVISNHRGHGHCHQKALVGTAPTVEALAWAGYEVSEVDSGCCGMAGSFGFEKEHYDISVALGGRRLAPAVQAAPAETEIVAPGISCRQQIEHLSGRRARHPAQLLRDSLDT